MMTGLPLVAAVLLRLAVPALAGSPALDQLVQASGAAPETGASLSARALSGLAAADGTPLGGTQALRAQSVTLEPGVRYYSWARCAADPAQIWSVCLEGVVVATPGHEHGVSPEVQVFDPPCRLNLPGNTDVFWWWEAPKFSSSIVGKIVFSGACAGEHTSLLESRVTGLVAFPPGPGYRLMDGTPRHPQVHFARPEVISAVQGVAARYRKDFPGEELAIGDASLPWGGLWDDGGDWKAPRADHRLGYEVDIDGGSIPPGQRERLKGLLEAAGARVSAEGRFLHLDFSPATPRP